MDRIVFGIRICFEIRFPEFFRELYKKNTDVNVTSLFQTAPTMVLGKSGQCIRECVRNESELLIYDFEKTMKDFGENGRASISDLLLR